MSGTDRSRAGDWVPQGPFCILVEPQLGENIGASARAMWNFGLNRMRVVAPRDGWPNPKAVAMASGAGRVLEEARLFDTAAAAMADLQVVYATTARPRDLIKRVLTPEAAMGEAAALTAEGARVGLLFGRERTGLETEEIVRASAIVTIPTNPAFASINLAQSVLLLAYEWRRAVAAAEPERLVTNRTEIAPQADVDRLVAHLTARLDAAEFFFPEHKRPAMLANLRNYFYRTPLTDQDIRTLYGVIRALGGRGT